MTHLPSKITTKITIEALNAACAGTAMETMGIEVVAVDDESIELHMPITDAARQPLGLLHGGVNMLLAETAASMHSAYLADLAREAPVGIEINGSHLHSAKSGTVKTVGRVLRRSRALVFHQIDIYHVESGRQLCSARVTNFFKPLPGANKTR